jgi:hypothetical protein
MRKIYFIITAVLFFILASPVFASNKYEFYNGGSNTQNIRNTIRLGQTFTASSNHTISGIKLLIDKVGSPGVCETDIYLANGSHLPIGSILTYGTYNGSALPEIPTLTEISVTEIDLTKETEYAIINFCSNGDNDNLVEWNINFGSPYGTEKGLYSADTGATWSATDYNGDGFQFEIWGNPIKLLKIINPIIPNLNISSSSDFFATASSLVTGLWLLIAITIGVPLGFWIIYKIMDLMPPVK